MEEKILQAIRTIADNPNKISSVYRIRKEQEYTRYYFLYNERFVWSVEKLEDDDFFDVNDTLLASKAYTATYYPGASIDDITRDFELAHAKKSVDELTYTPSLLKSEEALNIFDDLYRKVNELYFGFERILDEIIDHSKENEQNGLSTDHH